MALYGIDVSHWQGDINYDLLVGDTNGDFVIAKASEGKKTKDSKFSRNMTECYMHGILRGAYHYVRGDCNWYEQANNFLSTVLPVWEVEKDVLLALDVEDKTLVARGAHYTAQLVDDMVQEIVDQTGVYPLIYVSRAFMSTDTFARLDNLCGGWIASWGTPNKPKRRDLNTSIWQYTSKGRVEGINGYVDLNRAYMSIPAWHKFANPRG